MFTKARLTLTFWYSIIILTISILFSLSIYSLVNRDLIRISRSPLFGPYPTIIAEARLSLITNLGFANLTILVISATAGWFLAGRTLSPIQEMLDEQSRFIADASHELRTPLTALRTQIEVNLRDPALNLPVAKDILKSNLEDVVDLQRLTNNLISLAQHQEKPTLQPTIVKTSELIQTAIKKVSTQAAAKQHHIQSESKSYSVLVDPKSLVEVLVILLDNAIKYSPLKSQITIKSNSSSTGVTISVTNPGSTISRRDLPHLFDRFFRGDKSRTSDGFGLGLSIAKKLIEANHGSISVKSTATHTTFNLKVPSSRNPQILYRY